MSKPNLVGGRLFRISDEFVWVQWVKGKRSTLKDTNFAATNITPEHPKYERIKAVFGLLVDKDGSPFHVDLVQDEWDELIQTNKTKP